MYAGARRRKRPRRERHSQDPLDLAQLRQRRPAARTRPPYHSLRLAGGEVDLKLVGAYAPGEHLKRPPQCRHKALRRRNLEENDLVAQPSRASKPDTTMPHAVDPADKMPWSW